MARGNEIIVSANPRGVFMEGFLGSGTTKPGCVVQIDPTVAVQGNRHAYKPYTTGTTGNRPKGPLFVVRTDDLLGKAAGNTFVAGDRLFLYTPVAGEELNMILADVAGTADSHPAGEQLMVQDTTGKLVVTTGTPQSTPFTLLEAVTQPTADTLAWCLYSGY